ncbi:CueP family metal-binding protein [Glaciibacter psychrotolerans]|uniref:CueP family metal-binding protein n=1 Tax=Glaciibacter psychrotolerans TaxID=670054 RepID=A0A7Z0ECM1_9MICO|nr:CueP family metal-binding protein [Leifsonia psychrotolerans]NYJ18554.1 hypothetical protein [Leifsonia psychrotolerans]
MSKPRIFTVASAIFATVLLLAGCAAAQPAAAPTTQEAGGSVIAELGLEGLDARQVVETLDALPVADRPDGLTTSITAHQVTLTDRHGHAEELALPEDIVYISVAPYLSQTHDCYFHSPTGCIGELRNTEVEVTVTSITSGETVFDESLRTLDNGFVGMWLPRDIDASISVTHEGRTATSTLSTAGDDVQTCVTTLQLM